MEAYLEKNGEQLQRVMGRLKALEGKLSDEERKALGQRMMERSDALTKKIKGSLMTFSQKCPEHVARFT